MAEPVNNADGNDDISSEVSQNRVPAGRARHLLLLVCALVAAESVVLLIFAALDLRDLNSDRLGFGIGTAVLLTVYSVGIFFAAVQLVRGHAWGRGLVVAAQLIQILLAYNLRDVNWPIPVSMAVTGAVVLVAVLSKPVSAAVLSPIEYPDE